MNAVISIDSAARRALHDEILALHGVDTQGFSAERACRDRVEYLKAFLRNTGLQGFVLGISGGVDSCTAGRMAQLACEELRAEGRAATFHAMRLPAGVQFDETDAQDSLAFIAPDRTLTVNIGETATALASACRAAQGDLSESQADYHKGNVKARVRMAAQYYIAAATGSAVVGTDHNAEAVTGFFSKHGDGACDLIVLNGLSKRQVRACAKHLGAPAHLWSKAPTADLEELNPGKLDDDGFGFPYEALNDFLEGLPVAPDIEAKILEAYDRTRHKRDPIVAFPAN